MLISSETGSLYENCFNQNILRDRVALWKQLLLWIRTRGTFVFCPMLHDQVCMKRGHIPRLNLDQLTSKLGTVTVWGSALCPLQSMYLWFPRSLTHEIEALTIYLYSGIYTLVYARSHLLITSMKHLWFEFCLPFQAQGNSDAWLPCNARFFLLLHKVETLNGVNCFLALIKMYWESRSSLNSSHFYLITCCNVKRYKHHIAVPRSIMRCHPIYWCTSDMSMLFHILSIPKKG